MSRATALVDGVKDISQPGATGLARERAPAQYVKVAFSGGRSGLLNMQAHQSQVWAEVLVAFRETGRLAYVEIDPETSVITEVLQPFPFYVGRIERVDDGLQVELIISHAHHFLRRFNPDFEELRKALEDARKKGTVVLVTESIEGHEIIDARPVPGEAPRPRKAKARGR